jgi:predicted component of type VI protein secretion system
MDVLYKKKMVSKIVGDILDNKHFQKKEVSPLIQISKQLQYIITAIRVVYRKEVKREVLGRFVPTLLNLINDEIRQYGIAMKISEHANVINSRTHIKIICV